MKLSSGSRISTSMSRRRASAIRTCVESSSVSRFTGEGFIMLTGKRQPKLELRLPTRGQSFTQSIYGSGPVAFPLLASVGDYLRIRRAEPGGDCRHRVEQRGGLAPLFRAG